MQLIPTHDQIVRMLRDAGALREGHFEYSNGIHTCEHIDPALAMRSYQNAKVLNVALSRQIRAQPDLIAVMPEISLVAATPNGLPIAYGLSYVLAPRRVYWVEKPGHDRPMAFRPYMEPKPSEKVILVDDILRSGTLLDEARKLVASFGGEVVAIAVLTAQRTPKTVDFGCLPVYSVITLETRAYSERTVCDLCRKGIEPVRIGQVWEGGEHLHAESATSI